MQLDLPVIALLLVIVGALNWGTVALLNIDLVKYIPNANVEKVIKLVIGAAAVYILFAKMNNRVSIIA